MKRWCVLAWMAAWLVPAMLSWAQPGDAEKPLTVLAQAGFGDLLPADRWAPVRVIVSPREEAIEGIARVRFIGPGGLDLASIAPLTTTPGRETVLPMTVWVPARFDAMQVDFLDGRGRRLAGSRYDQSGLSTSIYIDVPTTNPIVLVTGVPSLTRAFGRMAYERAARDDDERDRLDMAALARIVTAAPLSPGQPPWLPGTAAAYEGLSVVVLDGSIATSLGPDALGAMREWLLGGGRIMLVNADGNALRAVFGEHTPDGLSFLPPRSVPLPEALGASGDVVARELARPVIGGGWRPLEAAPGLGAQGPIGLGWAMVLGLDPGELDGANPSGEVETLWQATLGVLIREDLETARIMLGSRRYDQQPTSVMAGSSVYAWLSRSPSVGIGAFIAIFAMMLALAVLLGPIDRFVLRRTGLLHRWWLMALGWIALASVGAWLLPGMVRSGPTNVTSVRVVDALETPDGTEHAWQASYTGVFMNRSATIELHDAEVDAWVSPWTSPAMYYGPSMTSGSVSWTASGSVMRPSPTVARLWTLRHFREVGPTTPPIAARFEVDGGRMVLRVSGPAAGRVQQLSVHTGGKWLNMLPGGRRQDTGDGFTIAASVQDISSVPATPFNVNQSDNRMQEFQWWDGSNPPTPWLLTHLPGPSSRTEALERLGAHEDWAVVYASWSDEHRSLAGNVGEDFTTLWSCRLAVPIRTMGEASPAAGGGR